MFSVNFANIYSYTVFANDIDILMTSISRWNFLVFHTHTIVSVKKLWRLYIDNNISIWMSWFYYYVIMYFLLLHAVQLFFPFLCHVFELSLILDLVHPNAPLWAQNGCINILFYSICEIKWETPTFLPYHEIQSCYKSTWW